MVIFYPEFQSDSSTYYAEKEIAEGGTGIINVPAAVGAISFDVYANGAPCKYSIYASLSKTGDAVNDLDTVIWHPTQYQNVTTDLLAVMSGIVGCYKIACITGNLTVKVRGK